MELLEEVTYPQAAGRAARAGAPRCTARPIRGCSRPTSRRSRSCATCTSGAGPSPSSWRFYGVARSEGLVLRYLSDAYRALRQTVPERVKTDELDDIVEWLGETVRQIDSSLLDEWEALTDPESVARAAAAAAAGEALAAAAPDHRQRARVPGDGPQRDVPEGAARGARPLRRARHSSRPPRRRSTRPARAVVDERRRVGGRARRLLGRVRDAWTPDRRRARRGC